MKEEISSSPLQRVREPGLNPPLPLPTLSPMLSMSGHEGYPRGGQSVGRITIDTNVHFGQPCIAGTRIPVYCILELVPEGIPFDEIVRRYYPDITVEDVKACVQYATALVQAESLY